MYKLITIFIFQFFLINSINLWALGVQGISAKGVSNIMHDEMQYRSEKKYEEIKISNISGCEKKNGKIFLQIDNKKYELDKYYFNEFGTKIEIKKDNIKNELGKLVNKNYKLSLIANKLMIRRKIGLKGGGIRDKADLENYWQKILNDEDSKTAVRASENILLNMSSHQSFLIEPLRELDKIDPRKVDEPYTVFLNLIEALANKRALAKKPVIIRKIAMFARQYLYMSYLTMGRNGRVDTIDIKNNLALLKKRYKKTIQSGIYYEVLVMSWEVDFLNTFRNKEEYKEEFVKLGKKIAFAVKDIGSFISWNHEEIVNILKALTSAGINAGVMIGTLGTIGDIPIDEIFEVFSSVYQITTKTITAIVNNKKFKKYMQYDQESKDVVDSKKSIEKFLKNTNFNNLSLITSDWVLVHKVVECLYFMILCSNSDNVKRKAFDRLEQFSKFKEFIWTNNWRIRQKTAESLIYLANLQREDSYKYEKDELYSIIEDASNLLESRKKYEKDARVKYILESPIKVLATLEKLTKVDPEQFIEKQDREEQQVEQILKNLWHEQKGNFDSVISDLSYIKSNIITKEEFEKANENHDELKDKMDELMFYQKRLGEKHEKELKQISSCLQRAEKVQDRMLNILITVEKTVKKLDSGQKEILKEIREYKESKDLMKKIIKNRRELLKDDRNKQLHEEMKNFYIDLKGKKESWHFEDQSFDLSYKVNLFLQGQNKVLLLLGVAGAGKSLFVKKLDKQLCDKWKGEEYLPIFIHLASIKDPVKNLIEETLNKLGISSHKNINLKNKKFLFILDGYDEIEEEYKNEFFYYSNKFMEWKNSKFIFTCREEYLDLQSEDFICPKKISEKIYILPFDKLQRDNYLKKYSALNNDKNWTFKKYKKYIKGIQGLEALSNVPITLKMVTTILPEIVKKKLTKISRKNIYDEFMLFWFEREWDKLALAGTLKKLKKTTFHHYVRMLAVSLYKDNKNAFTYFGLEPRESDDDWEGISYWCKLFDINKGFPIFRQQQCFHAMPIKRVEKYLYGFWHDSFIDYFVNNELERMVKEKEDIVEFIKIINTKLVSKSMLDFMVVSINDISGYQERLFEIIERSKTDKNIKYAASNAITALNKAGISFSERDLSNINIPKADLSYAIMDSTILKNANLESVIFQQAWLRNADFRNTNMQGINFKERACLKFKKTDKINSLESFLIEADSFRQEFWLKDKKTGKYIQKIECEYHTVDKIRYIAKHKLIAIVYKKKEILLYDIKTGKLKRELKGHKEPITDLIYIQEHNLLVSGSIEGTIYLWDIINGKQLEILKADMLLRSLLYVSEKNLLVGGCAGKIFLWDIPISKEPKIIHIKQDGWFHKLLYIPEFKLISGLFYESIFFLDTINMEYKIFKEKYSSTINALIYISKYKLLAIGYGETIYLWDVIAKKQLREFNGHNSEIMDLIYSPKDDFLMSYGDDGRICFWDIKEILKQSKKVSNNLTNSNSLIYISENKSLVSQNYNGMSFFNIDTGQKEKQIDIFGNKLVHLPKYKSIATYEDKTIYLWDIKTNELKKKLNGHEEIITDLVYISEYNLLASSDYKGIIHLWDINKGTCYKRIQTKRQKSSYKKSDVDWMMHPERADGLTYIPGYDLLASLGSAYKIRFSNIKNGNEIEVFKKTFSAEYLEYIPEYNLLATDTVSLSFLEYKLLATDNEDFFCYQPIFLYNIKTGELEKILSINSKNSVEKIIYIKEHKLLVNGDAKGNIYLWDLDTYENVLIIKGTKSIIKSIVFIPENKYLAIGSDDGIKIWKLNFLCNGKIGNAILKYNFTLNPQLNVENMQLDGACQLSSNNKKLLIQKGAVITSLDQRKLLEKKAFDLGVSQEILYYAFKNKNNQKLNLNLLETDFDEEEIEKIIEDELLNKCIESQEDIELLEHAARADLLFKKMEEKANAELKEELLRMGMSIEAIEQMAEEEKKQREKELKEEAQIIVLKVSTVSNLLLKELEKIKPNEDNIEKLTSFLLLAKQT